MILVDTDLRYQGEDLIKPFRPERVQPASYDLALGEDFIVFPDDIYAGMAIDLDDIENTEKCQQIKRSPGQGLMLKPGEFVLGVTEEVVHVPDNLVARLEGKSSIGRIGLTIHVTAGFVDCGWVGRLTLEIANLRKRPIILRPGKTFCQISFTKTTSPAAEPYHGRYQGDDSVASSRYAG